MEASLIGFYSQIIPLELRKKVEKMQRALSAPTAEAKKSWADIEEEDDIEDYAIPTLPAVSRSQSAPTNAAKQEFDPELDNSRDGINLFMKTALTTAACQEAPIPEEKKEGRLDMNKFSCLCVLCFHLMSFFFLFQKRPMRSLTKGIFLKKTASTHQTKTTTISH